MLPGWKTFASCLVTALYVAYSLTIYSTLETIGEPDYSRKVQCLKFKGVEGARDIIRIDNKLYVTAAADRVSELCGRKGTGFESGLYSLSMEGSDLYPLVIVHKIEILNYPSGISFNPHTVSFNPTSRELLAVVHGYSSGGERIDTFTLLNPEDQRLINDNDDESTAYPDLVAVFKSSVHSSLFHDGLLGTVAHIKYPYFIVAAAKPFGHSQSGQTAIDDLFHLASLALLRKWSYLLLCNSADGLIETSCEKLQLSHVDDNGQLFNVTKQFHEVGGLAVDEWGRVWVSDVLTKKITILKPIIGLKGRPQFTTEATFSVPVSVFGLSYDSESGQMVAAGTFRILSYMEWPYHYDPSNSSFFPTPSSTFFIDISTFNISSQLILTGSMLSVVSSASLIPGTSWMIQGSSSDEGVLLCEVTGFLPRHETDEI